MHFISPDYLVLYAGEMRSLFLWMQSILFLTHLRLLRLFAANSLCPSVPVEDAAKRCPVKSAFASI